MDPDMNYGHRSMDEIVFEEKNKAYGAYVHRQLYTKNLLKGLIISISVFVLAVLMPSIVRFLGLFDDAPLELTRTNSVELLAPPSDYEQSQQKDLPEQIETRTDELTEWKASDREEIKDTVNKADAEKSNTSKSDASKGDNRQKSDSAKKGDNGAGGNTGGQVLNKAEIPPEFVGGEDAYFEFMRANMVYPDKENKAGIEGRAKVYYIVGPDGAIEHASIHRSSGNSNLDAEALRLISMQPRYKPGRQNGMPVKVGIIVEVTFSQ